MIVKLVLVLATSIAVYAQEPSEAGRKIFENRCSGCHGADGNGGELGPAIASRVRKLTDTQIRNTVHEGVAGRMPPINVNDTDMQPLISFLRTLRRLMLGFQPYRSKVELTSGQLLNGLVVGESFDCVQMRTDDKHIHLLRRTESDKFREVTSEVNWTTYNGDIGGNRYTTMTQIDKSNVKRVAPRWVFTLPNVFPLEGTPIVMDGVMYVTSANECYALDAGSGGQIWHFKRDRTPGLTGVGAAGMNRGVAIAGDKVFMVTDNAHLIALNKAGGELVWEAELADWHKNYSATSAPLVIGNLVISGIAGRQERKLGALGRYPHAANPARKHGTATALSTDQRQHGLPVFMTRKPKRFCGPQEILERIITATSVAATISIPIAFWRLIPRLESSNGTTKQPPTISGIGIRLKRL